MERSLPPCRGKGTRDTWLHPNRRLCSDSSACPGPRAGGPRRVRSGRRRRPARDRERHGRRCRDPDPGHVHRWSRRGPLPHLPVRRRLVLREHARRHPARHPALPLQLAGVRDLRERRLGRFARLPAAGAPSLLAPRRRRILHRDQRVQPRSPELAWRDLQHQHQPHDLPGQHHRRERVRRGRATERVERARLRAPRQLPHHADRPDRLRHDAAGRRPAHPRRRCSRRPGRRAGRGLLVRGRGRRLGSRLVRRHHRRRGEPRHQRVRRGVGDGHGS